MLKEEENEEKKRWDVPTGGEFVTRVNQWEVRIPTVFCSPRAVWGPISSVAEQLYNGLE